MEKIIEIYKSHSAIEYETAIDFMEKRVNEIHFAKKNELVWFLEHPHIYTAGTSAQDHELLLPGIIPVHKTGRGGKFTYHGPGQRIIYLMLNLDRFNNDIRYFIETLEKIIVQTFKSLGICVFANRDRIGIWTKNIENDNHEKIGAIGLKVKKWISLHGIAVNINPDMQYFSGIIPCGLSDFRVTSLNQINKEISMKDFDIEFIKCFEKHISILTEADCLKLTE
tara:strand:+ start:561 stop:1232 length:672 start_codon:yes stop_codon:yes gene_type:complete